METTDTDVYFPGTVQRCAPPAYREDQQTEQQLLADLQGDYHKSMQVALHSGHAVEQPRVASQGLTLLKGERRDAKINPFVFYARPETGTDGSS